MAPGDTGLDNSEDGESLTNGLTSGQDRQCRAWELESCLTPRLAYDKLDKMVCHLLIESVKSGNKVEDCLLGALEGTRVTVQSYSL